MQPFQLLPAQRTRLASARFSCSPRANLLATIVCQKKTTGSDVPAQPASARTAWRLEKNHANSNRLQRQLAAARKRPIYYCSVFESFVFYDPPHRPPPADRPRPLIFYTHVYLFYCIGRTHAHAHACWAHAHCRIGIRRFSKTSRFVSRICLHVFTSSPSRLHLLEAFSFSRHTPHTH